MAKETRWPGRSMSKVPSRARAHALDIRSSAAGALAFGLLAALSFGSVGCSDVKKCKKGTEGCLDGKPFEEGTPNERCSFGLVVENGKCVEAGEDTARDGGRDSGTDGGRDGGTGSCDCAADEVCSPEDGTTCLSYCDAEERLTAIAPPPGCSDYSGTTVKPLTYAQACKNSCLQYCKRAEVYCPGFVCDETACDGAQQMQVCATECPGNDVDCMTTGCEELRDIACADFACPDAFPKSCTDVRCTDSCTGGNNKDGYCDDGDPFSASYDFCAYGTDCGDCGPRRGPKAPVQELGGNCVRDVGCPGFDADFLKTESWCLNVPGTDAAQFACIPNCTGHEDETDYCPEGFACQGLEYSDGTPFTNPSGLQGYGCVPLVCQ